MYKDLFTYDPFWEEREDYVEDAEKTWHMGYETGYSKGYSDGCKTSMKVAVLEHEKRNLENLLTSQLRILYKYKKVDV